MSVATSEKPHVRLTNLDKPFWPELNILKGDLLDYYEKIAPVLLPHLVDRAMVMKRYPDGAYGHFFFQKHIPDPHPEFIKLCTIEHKGGNMVDFPIIDSLPALQWLVNLGCIDCNQWYARCDDTSRPDYLHFDLDPVAPADFDRVLEAALILKQYLDERKIPCHPKTSGSRGMHLYVPIVRGPLQKQVWIFAKKTALELAALHPKLLTAEFHIAKRPKGSVLVDYNQNAWGRTLASVYSVRPKPNATVSAPVTWDEVEKGFRLEDFRLDNMPQRVKKLGDIFKPLLSKRRRLKLEEFL